jgi:hypothetical protein
MDEPTTELMSRTADLDDSGRSAKRMKGSTNGSSIPSLTLQGLPEEADILLNTYQKYKVIHLTNLPLKKGPHLSWKAIQSIFDGMENDDKETWCVEQGSSAVPATEFLDPSNKSRGYCSFLLHQKKEETLAKLPVDELPMFSWAYGPAVWFFFGRNHDAVTLNGRPEHTDAVSHDGTWHFQLSGTKRWLLRPTDDLRKEFLENNVAWDILGSVPVDCCEGDVLIINTRLWWHQTEIPKQDVPSISYARDFHFSPDTLDDHEPMCNVDGVYAANEIAAGTVVFREDEMPECSLHRSKLPNCDLVELEDGTCAVVSLRKISLGEFFSVPESSDEDESDFEGSEEEELELGDDGEISDES